ncbi:MAG: peroxiredoxin [Bermanella sp.]|jgi:peroxiredoxin
MSILYNVRIYSLIFTLFFITGCQEDLFPSNDQLPENATAIVGTTTDDFSFTLSTSNTELISSRLQTADAVVLYFTMWCPVCDSHMQYIRNNFRTEYNNVEFIFVDYVSGSINFSSRSQRSSGYSDFDVIADIDDNLQAIFSGTMATTVVIDKNFIIKMNEAFKTGDKLKSTLDLL